MKKLTLTYAGQDSWDRYVYRDQNGNLWKHVDCTSSRAICIERGDTLYSACNNEFDGEPDWPMDANIEVEFAEPDHSKDAAGVKSANKVRAESGVRKP